MPAVILMAVEKEVRRPAITPSALRSRSDPSLVQRRKPQRRVVRIIRIDAASF